MHTKQNRQPPDKSNEKKLQQIPQNIKVIR